MEPRTDRLAAIDPEVGLELRDLVAEDDVVAAEDIDRIDRLRAEADLLPEGEVARREAGERERQCELSQHDREEDEPAPVAHAPIRASSRLRCRSSRKAIPRISTPAPIIPAERGSADQKTSK